MDNTLAEIHQTLTAIPVFEGMAADSYKTQRLGGLTNLVFRIDTAEDHCVLRIPGKGTDTVISIIRFPFIT